MKNILEGWGSPFIKTLQIGAIVLIFIAGLFFLFFGGTVFAHVDLHFHSIQYDYEQEKRDQEARERKELEKEIKEAFPDSSKEERKEIYKTVKDLKDIA